MQTSLPIPQSTRVKDILLLLKPRILFLLAITSLCGALVAAKGNSALLTAPALISATLGLLLSAGGANMVNMWWDRDIDPLMKRTQNRPLPQGRMAPSTVLTMGIILILSGTLVAAQANLLAAAMALAGALFYVFIYTILLKRHTVQNIVIGGAAGAFPPLVGWAAVQNDLSHPLPWLMFAIIFLWTPPHFWALALVANADYTKAKVPMYPVVNGESLTRLRMFQYFLILFATTLTGALFYPLGWLYTLAALALGLWWGQSLWVLLHAPQTTQQNPQPAQTVFRRSLFYLAFLFAAMVANSWL